MLYSHFVTGSANSRLASCLWLFTRWLAVFSLGTGSTIVPLAFSTGTRWLREACQLKNNLILCRLHVSLYFLPFNVREIKSSTLLTEIRMKKLLRISTTECKSDMTKIAQNKIYENPNKQTCIINRS